MRFLRILLVLAFVLLLAAGGFVLWSQYHEIAAIQPPRTAFDNDLIKRGAGLAALGNCDVCHTVPGGAAYAGGRPIPTPFGTIYSTNITPDPETGIGRWSEDAFRRAMREGVAREGRHLYPAFPYNHYARVADDDIHALYAFIMTRTPVAQRPPANALPFPLNQRWIVAFWNLLYLDDTPFRANPGQNDDWNRGAYLVDGLGHCGDCHTPRNLLGAEKSSQYLAGGEGEGWSALALNASSPAPLPWNAAHLFAYLRRGWDAEHGAAAGPMQPIVEDLAYAEESDVRAIATYIAAQIGEPSPERREKADARTQAHDSTQPAKPNAGEEPAAAMFAGACAGCHLGGTEMIPPHGIDLRLSTAISAADPRDAILIVLDGIRPADGRPGRWMPRFDGSFTAAQLAALLGYVRAHYSAAPAWTDLETRVREIRHSREQS
ncbi:MAG: cytochrome c [Alphaproteobacteria bacterium]|nr:cytochrome c [Alphaproteobacteria bacterium]